MATLTITTTAAQAQRVATAFGAELNLETIDNPPLPRDATNSEVKALVVRYIKDVVLGQERRAASEAATAPITEIEPT